MNSSKIFLKFAPKFFYYSFEGFSISLWRNFYIVAVSLFFRKIFITLFENFSKFTKFYPMFSNISFKFPQNMSKVFTQYFLKFFTIFEKFIQKYTKLNKKFLTLGSKFSRKYFPFLLKFCLNFLEILSNFSDN